MLLGSLGLAASLSVASAQDLAPHARPTGGCACELHAVSSPASADVTLVQATAPTAPTAPNAAPGTAPPAAPPPETGAANFQPLVSAALGDTSFAAAAPQVMGDFGGYLTRRVIFAQTTATTTTTTTEVIAGKQVTVTTTRSAPVLVPVTVSIPVVARAGSGFKIADDASPIPTDRVFFSYNYFDSLGGQAGSNGGSTTTIAAPGPGVGAPGGATTTTTSVAPVAVPAASIDLHREIFGFEKTFFDGNASVEVRLPIFQSSNSAASGLGSGGFVGDDFGDVTTVFKYALVNERERVFSLGLATTFPTGPAVPGPDGNFRAVLFQPFVGFYRGYGDFFVEGFSSVVLSTESQDPTLLFNDVSFGYHVYRNPQAPIVTGLSTVIEAHVTTPLENRDSDSLGIVVPDILSFTAGVHIDLGARSELSIGWNVPVTGPRPYNSEALVQLNYRF
jgi:hypothetical protein